MSNQDAGFLLLFVAYLGINGVIFVAVLAAIFG
jgi:hypothetical protein